MLVCGGCGFGGVDGIANSGKRHAPVPLVADGMMMARVQVKLTSKRFLVEPPLRTAAKDLAQVRRSADVQWTSADVQRTFSASAHLRAPIQPAPSLHFSAFLAPSVKSRGTGHGRATEAAYRPKSIRGADLGPCPSQSNPLCGSRSAGSAASKANRSAVKQSIPPASSHTQLSSLLS